MANHSSVLVWRISRTQGLGLAGYGAGGLRDTTERAHTRRTAFQGSDPR